MNSDSVERFGEPRPRIDAAAYKPFNWPAGLATSLGTSVDSLEVDLAEVLTQRSTRRSFERLELSQLAALLWLSCRTHSRAESPYGFQQEYRPYPSAGALHPIHVLCQRGAGQPWERYDSKVHALIAVPDTAQWADAARAQANQAVLVGEAVLLALAAEPGRTGAKYEDYESLVWRDAGVALGFLALVSEALGLSFCPLGMTGDDFVKPISPQNLRGAGLALLGAI